MRKRGIWLILLSLVMSATCIAFASCDKDEIPAHDHVIETIAGKDATCTESGLTDGEKCSLCGETIKAQEVIPAKGHLYDNGKVTKEATCEEEGVKTYTCRVCGDTKTESVAAKAHSWNKGEVTKAATCQEDGLTTFTCKVCGATKTEVIEKGAHQAVIIPAVAATCTAEGLTEGKVCSVCGEVLVAQQKTPLAAHTVSYYGYEEPTCYCEGYTGGSMCLVCGQVLENRTLLPQVDHVYENGVCIYCGEVSYSSKLVFELSEDETYYIVTGYNWNGGRSDYGPMLLKMSYDYDEEYEDDGEDNANVVIPAVYDDGEHGELPVKEIGSRAFYRKYIQSVLIPASVTTIGESAFENCSQLNAVIFEENSQLEEILSSAFKYCRFNEFTLPASVKTVGGNAFYYCGSLVNFRLEEGSVLESIGEYAFYDVYEMLSFVVPETVTSIGEDAFGGCSNLYRVTNNSTAVTKENFPTAKIYVDNTKETPEVTIQEGISLSEVEEGAFVFQKRTLTVNEVQGDYYFLLAYLGDEEEVTLPADYNGEEYQMESMKGIRKLVIPEGFTSIKELSLSGNSTFTSPVLTEITIPSTVTFIEANTFRYCRNLENIFVAEGNTVYQDIDGVLFTKENQTLVSYPVAKGNDYYVPDGTKVIGEYAFENNYKIKSVVIPASVTSIEKDAFASSGLREITFEENSSLETIANRAFHQSYMETITIPATVKTIGESAFRYSNLIEVNFEENSVLESIGEYAFQGVRALTSIVIPASVKTIGDCAFNSCYALSSLIFEDGGEELTIGDSAFYYCYKLPYLEFPSQIKKIGSSAFYNCYNIIAVSFKEESKLETIGGSAFSGCASLTGITIPTSVTTIESYAFSDCNALAFVRYAGTENEWAAIWTNIENANGNQQLMDAYQETAKAGEENATVTIETFTEQAAAFQQMYSMLEGLETKNLYVTYFSAGSGDSWEEIAGDNGKLKSNGTLIYTFKDSDGNYITAVDANTSKYFVVNEKYYHNTHRYYMFTFNLMKQLPEDSGITVNGTLYTRTYSDAPTVQEYILELSYEGSKITFIFNAKNGVLQNYAGINETIGEVPRISGAAFSELSYDVTTPDISEWDDMTEFYSDMFPEEE